MAKNKIPPMGKAEAPAPIAVADTTALGLDPDKTAIVVDDSGDPLHHPSPLAGGSQPEQNPSEAVGDATEDPDKMEEKADVPQEPKGPSYPGDQVIAHYGSEIAELREAGITGDEDDQVTKRLIGELEHQAKHSHGMEPDKDLHARTARHLRLISGIPFDVVLDKMGREQPAGTGI